MHDFQVGSTTKVISSIVCYFTISIYISIVIPKINRDADILLFPDHNKTFFSVISIKPYSLYRKLLVKSNANLLNLTTLYWTSISPVDLFAEI